MMQRIEHIAPYVAMLHDLKANLDDLYERQSHAARPCDCADWEGQLQPLRERIAKLLEEK